MRSRDLRGGRARAAIGKEALPAFLTALVVLTAVPAPASAWTLRMREAVTLPAGEVRLADILAVASDTARTLGPDRGLPPAAAELVVAAGGRPGQVVAVDRQLVLRRLRQAGLAHDVRCAEPAICRITFVGRTLVPGELRAWLQEELKVWLPAPPPGAPATWLEIEVAATHAAFAEPHPVLEDPRPLAAGRNLVPVVVQDGERRVRLTTLVTCHLHGEVARAIAPIPRSSELKPEQFAWEWRDLSSADRGLLVGRQTLAGLSARRDLAAGQWLREPDVKTTPLVRAGQPVELRLARGAVMISAPAVARQDGSLGQTITVRNELNGSLMTGRVCGPGAVELRARR
jgi:flagella basal body P-ring formation protein FlgA